MVMGRSMLFVSVVVVTLVVVAIVKSGESIPVPEPMMLFCMVKVPISMFSKCIAFVVAAFPSAYVP